MGPKYINKMIHLFKNMCIKAAEVDISFLELIPDQYRTQKIIVGLLKPILGSFIMFLIVLKDKKCITVWCAGIYIIYSLSLIS